MKPPVIQRHHISYDPEVTVDIYKSEHLILTKIQWFCKNRLSLGFLRALAQFIADNLYRATELKK